MVDPKPAIVRIQYNKAPPHKIAAHRGGEDSAATPPIILREGLNHVPASAWAEAKKLPVVLHHLTAKVVPVLRDGKHVTVPLIEELGDAPTAAEKKKAAGPTDAEKAKAEAEAAAERERAAAEAKAKEDAAEKAKAEAEAQARRNQSGGGGQQGRGGR